MTSESRVDLNVPYREKDEAKQYGACFDWERKVWYVPPGINLSLFSKWLPPDLTQAVTPTPRTTDEKGMVLSAYLARISEAVRQVGMKPEWVRCEVSEIKDWAWGSVVELVETDARGKPIAKSGAKIWSREKARVFERFEQATGSALAAGMKVMLQVTAEFDIQYSFSLHIKDIDPVYTLGDMAAKLRQIRENLKQKGLYDRNKRFSMPGDYFRLAVVSPQKAAALGDWQTEANILQRHGVCEFAYFTATFQGDKAEDSVTAAIESALAIHADQAFDALVVIRGGGASLDLASLNSEKIATALCTAPLPVLTGIGHERDTVILDEVACHRFDTPSKVANHVFTIIQRRAERIKANVGSILRLTSTTSRIQRQSIDDRWGAAAAHARSAVRYTTQQLIVPAHRLRGSASRINVQARYRLASQVDALTSHIVAVQRRATSLAESKTHTLVIRARKELEVAAMQMPAQMRAVRRSVEQRIRQSRADARRAQAVIHSDALRARKDAARFVSSAWEKLAYLAKSESSQARTRIDSLYKGAIGLGPDQILARGFTLVRDLKNNVVPTKKKACALDEMEIQFQDDRLRVRNAHEKE